MHTLDYSSVPPSFVSFFESIVTYAARNQLMKASYRPVPDEDGQVIFRPQAKYNILTIHSVGAFWAQFCYTPCHHIGTGLVLASDPHNNTDFFLDTSGFARLAIGLDAIYRQRKKARHITPSQAL